MRQDNAVKFQQLRVLEEEMRACANCASANKCTRTCSRLSALEWDGTERDSRSAPGSVITLSPNRTKTAAVGTGTYLWLSENTVRRSVEPVQYLRCDS
jgi:hypothetical protein